MRGPENRPSDAEIKRRSVRLCTPRNIGCMPKQGETTGPLTYFLQKHQHRIFWASASPELVPLSHLVAQAVIQGGDLSIPRVTLMGDRHRARRPNIGAWFLH